MSRCGVTFEPRQAALGAWQAVKGEAMSVNEALYVGVIEGTIWPDGSGRWFEADVVVLEAQGGAVLGVAWPLLAQLRVH